MVRAQLVINSNHRERSRYAEEKIRIQNTAHGVKDRNSTLHEDLIEAQNLLEVRKGYDKLSEKITDNTALRPRDEQQASIARLNAEIAELEAESQEYARTWSERREQFGKLVDEGEQLLRLIRDEKEEAERKEDMEDMAEEKESSRSGTPAGGVTPAHVPGSADTQSPSARPTLKEQNGLDDGAEVSLESEKPTTDNSQIVEQDLDDRDRQHPIQEPNDSVSAETIDTSHESPQRPSRDKTASAMRSSPRETGRAQTSNEQMDVS